MANDWDGSFEELVNNLGNLVGENELEARRVLGDTQYEKILAVMDKANELMLAKDAAQIAYLQASSFMQLAVGVVLFATVPFGLAWTLFSFFS
jgi:hypothetical protein